MAVDATKIRFQLVTIDGTEALMTYNRIDRNTVPEGIYLYEIRDNDEGKPVLLRNNVDIGFSGSILINEPQDVSAPGMWIDGGLGFTGQRCSLAKYMRENPVQAQTEGPQMGGLSQ